MISVESNAWYEIQTDEKRSGGDRVLRSTAYIAWWTRLRWRM